MRILWIVVFFIIPHIGVCQNTPSSPDSLELFRKLSSTPIQTPLTKEWLEKKDGEFNRLNSFLGKYKLDSIVWNKIFIKWTSFKDFACARLAVKNRNSGDQQKIKERWSSLQNELQMNEGILFPDIAVIKKLRDIDSALVEIYNGRKPDYPNIKFFRKMNNKLYWVERDLDTISSGMKRLEDYVFNRNTTINTTFGLTGYNGNFFSIGALHVIDTSKYQRSPFTIAGEIMISYENSSSSNFGGFIFGGVQTHSIVLLAGIGYLENTLKKENIGWKGSFIYYPAKSFAGFGLSYSPITNLGLSVHIKSSVFK